MIIGTIAKDGTIFHAITGVNGQTKKDVKNKLLADVSEQFNSCSWIKEFLNEEDTVKITLKTVESEKDELQIDAIFDGIKQLKHQLQVKTHKMVIGIYFNGVLVGVRTGTATSEDALLSSFRSNILEPSRNSKVLTLVGRENVYDLSSKILLWYHPKYEDKENEIQALRAKARANISPACTMKRSMSKPAIKCIGNSRYQFYYTKKGKTHYVSSSIKKLGRAQAWKEINAKRNTLT